MTSNPKSWNQKLSAREKLWCQMCRKQCRDQNGFDMHCKSKAHNEAMAIFSADPEKYIERFSSDFERDFLDVLSVKHGFNPARLNVTYSQYIADSMQHTRLSATKWATILDFVRELERRGKLKITESIDPISKGTLHSIQLVDVARLKREQAAEDEAAKASALRGKEEAALQREYKRRYDAVKQMQQQAGGEEATDSGKTEFTRGDGEAISLEIGGKPEGAGVGKGVFEDDDEANNNNPAKKRKKEGPRTPAPRAEDAPWPLPGIVVKILHPTLANGKYHKKKATIISQSSYTSTVKVADPPATIALDQEYLQTVIPQIGRSVMILKGPLRGTTGTLDAMLEKEYAARVRDPSGKVHTLKYEAFSKVA